MTDHYFTPNPETPSEKRTVDFTVRDLSVNLTTDRGVFSASRVDRGTIVLCNATIPPPVEGDLLDLGCGYGPIAIVLATRYSDRKVWAVDVNERAVELTRANAAALGLQNIEACLPADVPNDIGFAAIYSNPPIKVGKTVLHAMMNDWLPRLHDGGAAFLVVHKHLGSDSLQKWLDEKGLETKRILSSSGYRVLRAKSCLRAS